MLEHYPKEKSRPFQKQSNKIPLEQIQQLASKHYEKAMRYVHNKKKIEEQVEAQKIKEQEESFKRYSYRPELKPNKYNTKIEERRSKKIPKQIELEKWGRNHTALRRDSVIKGKVKEYLSHSVENVESKPQRVHRRGAVNKIDLDKSLSLTRDGNDSKQKQSRAEQIAGVGKFYLKQAKAILIKNNQTLFYRGSEETGFIFESVDQHQI